MTISKNSTAGHMWHSYQGSHIKDISPAAINDSIVSLNMAEFYQLWHFYLEIEPGCKVECKSGTI